jgi:DNA-binding NarL/FixJ family response regulator
MKRIKMLPKDASTPVRLLIANRSEVTACGPVSSFTNETDIQIVGVTNSIDQLLTLLASRAADVLLLDLGHEKEQLELIQTLSIRYPQLRVLLFCSILKPYIAYQLLGFGVTGILSWDIPLADIHQSVRAAAQGRIVIKHEVASRSLIIYFRDGLNLLTDRELSILKYVATGHTNRQIAECMHIATKTVETYISGVCSKLNTRSRTQAAVQAVLLGLVNVS